jgi:DNA-directed RNA polymerase specialized sigma24 family protein
MTSEDFFPSGSDIEQVVESRFAELYQRAGQEFPASLRRSPLVGYALEKAIARLRQGGDRHSFDKFLREQARDEKAGLVRAVQLMICNLVKRNKALARVADDIPNEVYVSLHRTSAVYDPAGAPFYGWLRAVSYRVAMRLLTKEFARSARTAEGADPALLVAPAPEPGASRDPIPSFAEILQQLIDALPDELDRRILHLRFHHAQPNESVARHLGLTMNGLYKRFERIRKRLAPLGGRYFNLD